MEYTQEEYTKFYIIQALFKLMENDDFFKIKIQDIAERAGVSRATFYRHFKTKEDIIIYYFEHSKKEFMQSQHYYPRCKEDYCEIVKEAMKKFLDNKDIFKLLRKSHIEYIYLNYLNDNFNKLFKDSYEDKHNILPYAFSGMLFNVSMAWLDDDCKEDIKELSKAMIDIINI